jgi:hypothetical protein
MYVRRLSLHSLLQPAQNHGVVSALPPHVDDLNDERSRMRGRESLGAAPFGAPVALLLSSSAKKGGPVNKLAAFSFPEMDRYIFLDFIRATWAA